MNVFGDEMMALIQQIDDKQYEPFEVLVMIRNSFDRMTKNRNTSIHSFVFFENKTDNI